LLYISDRICGRAVVLDIAYSVDPQRPALTRVAKELRAGGPSELRASRGIAPSSFFRVFKSIAKPSEDALRSDERPKTTRWHITAPRVLLVRAIENCSGPHRRPAFVSVPNEYHVLHKPRNRAHKCAAGFLDLRDELRICRTAGLVVDDEIKVVAGPGLDEIVDFRPAGSL